MKTKEVRCIQHGDLDSAFLIWFTEQRENNVPINGPMLQEKANSLVVLFKKESFSCSYS